MIRVVTDGPTGVVTDGPGGGSSGTGHEDGATQICNGSFPIDSIKGDCTAFLLCTSVGNGIKSPCPGAQG